MVSKLISKPICRILGGLPQEPQVEVALPLAIKDFDISVLLGWLGFACRR